MGTSCRWARLSSGIVGNADLSIPVNRVNLDRSRGELEAAVPGLRVIQQNEFEGTSQYHSLQVTLSRQTGKRLQYFVGVHVEPNHGHA